MYDEPEVRPFVDALWGGIAAALMEEGVQGVPEGLSRDLSAEEAWKHPRLLLGQACGYPVVTSLGGAVRVVGAAVHDVPGCPPGTYASVVVVRDEAPYGALDDLRGARCAVNHPESHSGMNALRAVVAPLAREGRFFGEVRASGRHRASLAMVRRGETDVASVDCVTYAIVARSAPADLAGLRVLCRTATAPALPFVTAAEGAETRLPTLRDALGRALSDPGLREARAALRISGFVTRDEDDYRVIADIARRAHASGYPKLA